MMKFIEDAIDNNIVVFDTDAKPGEFTKKLIGLMLETCFDYYVCGIDFLLIPDVGWYTKEGDCRSLGDYLTINAVIIGKTEVLNKGSEADKIVMKRNSLAPKDKFLALGRRTDGGWILGSF